MAAYNRAARRKAGKIMKRVADKHGTTLAEVREGLENCRRATPLHVRNVYRLAHGQVDYVFVVSSAISITTTWSPFFAAHGIRHKVIQKAADLRRVYQGDFVLITLGRVRNNQRAIQRIIRIGNRRVLLIYDEAHNSSALEEGDEGALTKATFACFRRLPYKLLMSGTAINNHVVEAYPQLYLLYNASCNMLSMAKRVYTHSDYSDSPSQEYNNRYGRPYPPYIEGRNLFRASHLPVKPTVFGVVKTTPDIYNAEVLRDMISYTMITRTFEEVSGKDLKRLGELPAVMTPEEEALYNVALKEFFRLEYLYFKSPNMSDREKAQSRIIAQIKLMLRACACAPLFPEYTGDGMTGKLQAICGKLAELSGHRVVIGVRHNDVVKVFAREIQKQFPHRPVFTITGSEYDPAARSDLVFGDFSAHPDSVLVCPQPVGEHQHRHRGSLYCGGMPLEREPDGPILLQVHPVHQHPVQVCVVLHLCR